MKGYGKLGLYTLGDHVRDDLKQERFSGFGVDKRKMDRTVLPIVAVNTNDVANSKPLNDPFQRLFAAIGERNAQAGFLPTPVKHYGTVGIEKPCHIRGFGRGKWVAARATSKTAVKGAAVRTKYLAVFWIKAASVSGWAHFKSAFAHWTGLGYRNGFGISHEAIIPHIQFTYKATLAKE